MPPRGKGAEMERPGTGRSEKLPPPVLPLNGRLQIAAKDRLRYPVLLLCISGLPSRRLLLIPLGGEEAAETLQRPLHLSGGDGGCPCHFFPGWGQAR